MRRGDYRNYYKGHMDKIKGEGGGGEGRGVYRSYYKGHMDKIKGEGGGGEGMWDWLRWGGRMERKCRQL